MVKRIKSNQMEVNCQLTSRFLCLFALATENKGNWHSVDDCQTQMFKLMRRYCCLFGRGPRWENLIRPREDGGKMIIGRTGGKRGSKVGFVFTAERCESVATFLTPRCTNTIYGWHLRLHLIKHDGSVVGDV